MSDPTAEIIEKPSLEHLQYLQNNWTRSDVSKSSQTAKVTVATGGDAGIAADIPVGAEIFGATVVCTRANGSGSMQIKTGAGSPVDISDAIICATDKAVTYAGEIDDANAVNIVGADGIKVFANAAADGGIVYIHYLK
jgi:hypothetical protein